MNKVFRVDMSTGEVSREELPAKWTGYGGRVLTDAIVFSEIPAKADPLGPQNKLVIAPGLFSGTTMANSGRLSFGAKSPLTKGIKESNTGGQMSHTLARLGIAAIIIEGKPADENARYVLVIEADGSVKMERRDELAFKKVYETCDILAAERPEGDRFAISMVGPAGEYGAQSAGIVTTDRHGIPNRFAGRGGLGSVMASKGLKAIIASDKGLPYRTPADKAAFQEAARTWATAIQEDDVSGTGLPTYGTNILMNILNEAKSLPSRNFTLGQSVHADKIGGETQRETILERSAPGEGEENASHGCSSGCIIKCSRYWVDQQGEYVTKGPEYETAWAFGADACIENLDDICNLDRLCGEIGLDTIETGAMMAVYMESGQIAYGDAEAAYKALEAGLTDPEMRVLWDGALAVGKKYGVDHVPTVKGQSMPAYDPRAINGIGVTYATTPMGADHTAGYTIAVNILGSGGMVDPLSPEGQVDLSRDLQIATATLDSFGLCIFVAFPILANPKALEALCAMVTAFTGEEFTGDDFVEVGKEALTFERMFNAEAGFTAADDRLPDFAYTEQIPGHDVVFKVTNEELDEVFNFVPATAAKMGI